MFYEREDEIVQLKFPYFQIRIIIFINLSPQVWLYSILLISGQRNFQRNEEIGFNWVVKVNRVFEQEQIALHYLRLQPTTTK